MQSQTITSFIPTTITLTFGGVASPTFVMQDLHWVGSHTFKLTTQVGIAPADPLVPAGLKLYKTNTSDAVGNLSIVVTNPCETTTFIAVDLKATQKLLAREHGGMVTMQYRDPTN